MKPMFMVDHESSWSLCMNAGGLPADDAVVNAGHEPNGYFWEGVAQILVKTKLQHLADSISFDPEGGMFCAISKNKADLESLAAVMLPIVQTPDETIKLITLAKELNFEFDD